MAVHGPRGPILPDIMSCDACHVLDRNVKTFFKAPRRVLINIENCLFEPPRNTRGSDVLLDRRVVGDKKFLLRIMSVVIGSQNVSSKSLSGVLFGV